MAINKVTYSGNVLLDLSEDTVTENDVAEGKTFHLANGEPSIGTGQMGGKAIIDVDELPAEDIRTDVFYRIPATSSKFIPAFNWKADTYYLGEKNRFLGKDVEVKVFQSAVEFERLLANNELEPTLNGVDFNSSSKFTFYCVFYADYQYEGYWDVDALYQFPDSNLAAFGLDNPSIREPIFNLDSETPIGAAILPASFIQDISGNWQRYVSYDAPFEEVAREDPSRIIISLDAQLAQPFSGNFVMSEVEISGGEITREEYYYNRLSDACYDVDHAPPFTSIYTVDTLPEDPLSVFDEETRISRGYLTKDGAFWTATNGLKHSGINMVSRLNPDIIFNFGSFHPFVLQNLKPDDWIDPKWYDDGNVTSYSFIHLDAKDIGVPGNPAEIWHYTDKWNKITPEAQDSDIVDMLASLNMLPAYSDGKNNVLTDENNNVFIY